MKSLSLKKPTTFSRSQLTIFIAIFALIGGYLIYRSLATAPLVATLEAEQMSLVAGSSVITDTSASSGKALLLSSNGTTTGSVNFPSSVTSLSLIAKGTQCNGSPTMNVSLDGVSLLSNQAVSSTSWTSYATTPTNAINSGTHSLSISFTNAYTSTGHGKHSNGYCTRSLYLDVTSFFGPTPTPTPAPTVSLSATPTSVSAGSASVLTWNSTNATSCTASGAWSGTQPTSGSASTGALNQTSTYTLSCTGDGGSATGSVVVSVSPVVPTISCSLTISAGAGNLQNAYPNLQPGQTLCLHGGTYTGSGYVLNASTGGTSASPVTIASYPGETAILLGTVQLKNTANNLILSGLDIVGDGTQNTVQVYGTNDVIQKSDITNNHLGRSCFFLGGLGSYGYDTRAVQTTLSNNRIHDCGTPANGSLDHCIYDAHSDNAIIRNNIFYNCQAYIIQFYPDSQGTIFDHNTTDGGAGTVRGGVIFGSEVAPLSSNNTVSNNILTYSVSPEIDGYWGSTPGSGNTATNNCTWAPSGSDVGTQTGFTASGTLHADPLFVDRVNHNYSLVSGSPCAGKGV